jgi:uncharacterized membrane protein
VTTPGRGPHDAATTRDDGRQVAAADARAGRGRRGHTVAIALGLLRLAGLALLPDLGPMISGEASIRLDHGRITALGTPDPETGGQPGSVLLLDGPRAGEVVSVDFEAPGPTALSTPFAVGEEVVVEFSVTPDGEFAAVSDHWRLPLLTWLFVGFVALVVIVGGWRGIRALIALALTLAVVVKVVLPLLLAGWAPVPVAVGIATAVTVVTMLLTEGPRRSTLAAAIGTFGALALTALIAAVVSAAGQFSPLQGSEEAGYLKSLLGADFDVGGLLLAAVIFGALGVLDDVTISQAATVAELAEADPSASRSSLVSRAMNVGRSHIAATINTLFLAYVAASLPLLLLFAVGRQAPSTIASTELVALEVVRAVVGSMGIVAAVPLTTFIAAWLERRAIDRRAVIATEARS